jgi:hypothetical protein
LLDVGMGGGDALFRPALRRREQDGIHQMFERGGEILVRFAHHAPLHGALAQVG